MFQRDARTPHTPRTYSRYVSRVRSESLTSTFFFKTLCSTQYKTRPDQTRPRPHKNVLYLCTRRLHCRAPPVQENKHGDKTHVHHTLQRSVPTSPTNFYQYTTQQHKYLASTTPASAQRADMASVVLPAPLLSAPESSRLLPRNRTTPRSSRGYVTCRTGEYVLRVLQQVRYPCSVGGQRV